MNVPNSLTLLRILLGIVVPFMMLTEDFELRIWAAVLFAIAGFTDWLDGWYARKYNLITKLGKILDPIADKIMVLGSFVVLSDVTILNVYSIWWVIPIFLREISITIYRLVFLLKKRPVIVAATWSGKAKTVMQMATLPCAYFYFMLHQYPMGTPILVQSQGIDLFLIIIYLMLFASLAFTLGSGYRFFAANWKTIKDVSF